jgi:hypothetical protein
MAEQLDCRQTSEPLGRRRFLRLPVFLPVIGHMPQSGESQVRGITRNVGSGGMMVEFPVGVVPGSEIRTVLHTQRGPVDLAGRVVWTSATGDRVRYGVAFQEPKDQDFAVDLFLSERR